MKKIFILLLFLPLLFCFAFKKAQKPFIVLSSGTISQKTTERVERVFYVKQRINYALIFPDGLKYTGVRMQISKQDDKTSNWGFSVISSKDLYLGPADNSYRDYIFIQRPGHYIIQFFYLNKKNYPFAHKEFMVK